MHPIRNAHEKETEPSSRLTVEETLDAEVPCVTGIHLFNRRPLPLPLPLPSSLLLCFSFSSALYLSYNHFHQLLLIISN